MIQTVSADIGGAGGGLGYSGIPTSVAVEFDTYRNFEFNDPSSNHIGIDINGSVDSLVTANVSPNFDNGEIWNARVVYDGVNLSVYIAPDGMGFGTPQLMYAIDIPSIIGGQEAFVGFTAGTAAAWGDHDLLQFSYNSTIPTPGALALLGGGLLGGGLLGFGRRRR